LQAQAGCVIDRTELDDGNQMQTLPPRRHKDTESILDFRLVFSVSPCLCGEFMR
jgi:hypothetical protein